MHQTTARPGQEPAAMVVEWAPFRLAEGVSEERLLAASEALQRDFLRHQSGFVRRELLRGPDGQWADLVYWTDQASVDAAMTAVAQSAICLEYFQCMVGADGMDPGAGLVHFRQARVY